VKLYVARHSDAGDFIGDDPKAERERPLTSNGKKLVQAVAAAMLDADQIPTVGFASPLERTKQTADMLGGILDFQVNVLDDLAPNRPLEDRLLELMAHDALRKFLIVCHVDNTTPAFENFGGDMGDCYRDGDEDTIGSSGHWAPLVKGEVRRLKIDRKTGRWECRWRLLPSDVGFSDDAK
jgi:phosphohistidine phosphatase SixA